LVRGALERGWEPVVLNPFARFPEHSDLAELCRPAPYTGKQCNTWSELPALRRWLGSTLRDFDPDILHAHLFHAGVAIASLQLPRGTRSLLTHHHGDHFVYSNNHTKARLDQWAGSRFDTVVAISDWVRRFLLQRYGYPDRRVEVIRNGWSGQPLPHQGSNGDPTAICVANFRSQKGHADLVGAFALALREVPNARLALVGEGPLAEPVNRAVEAAGISERVEFLGGVADVWPELARADLFVLASLYEPQGIAVIEAMAAGLPVVATDVGGVSELVEDGHTGLLAARSDKTALAQRLVELLTSPEERREMGAAGKRSVAGLTASASVDRYFTLYESLMESAR
jgi:glycosyltransferase involved in cell wall biosynthesis